MPLEGGIKMNRDEFMKTLNGFVPNKLADMLAELAEDEGYFQEEDVLPLSEATDSDLLAELSRRMLYNDVPQVRNAKARLYEQLPHITRNVCDRGHRRTKE